MYGDGLAVTDRELEVELYGRGKESPEPGGIRSYITYTGTYTRRETDLLRKKVSKNPLGSTEGLSIMCKPWRK